MPILMHRLLAQRPLLLATLFYLPGLLILALILRAIWFGQWLYAADLGAPSFAAVAIALTATAGLLAATPWMLRYSWAQRVAATIGQIFGSLSVAGALWLGIVSGFCEELLFRGALQPVIGLLPASAVFALMHAVGWWWLFAFLIGIGLGLLYAWDASIWSCVLAHALLNAVNLYRLSQAFCVADMPKPPLAHNTSAD